MSDVIDLVLVQADALHEIDLNFVGRRQSAHEVRACQPAVLGHSQHRRNVVAGMRIVRGEERVVEIEFADGHAVGPGGPFRRNPLRPRQPEHGGSRVVRMRLGLRSRADDGTPRHRGRGNGGVVDDAVAQHLHHVALDRDGIGGDLGDLPGQLSRAREMIGRFERTNAMLFQDAASFWMGSVMVGCLIGTGRPNSFTATISNVPRTADFRLPLIRSSRIMSTATVMELRPTRTT